ncbi:MAG: protein tyrosine phosphatase family protein [Pseudomonadota bacterium]
MAQDLPHILNWRRWNAETTLSGQPSEDQLAEIAALGVRRVINLGPHSNDGALEDEAGTVAALGMEYIYIPVDFEAPTGVDYAAFCDAISAGDGPTHVHCIYNARVSAFFYRYAKEGRGGDATRAFALMDGIWRPGGVWADFIGDDASLDQPNRFEGYEYKLDTKA